MTKKKLRADGGSPSKAALHVTLMYHQCVILSLRPLLLSALKERLKLVEQQQHDHREPSSLMRTFVATGTQSAVRSIQLLSNLTNQDLLDTFLPFDLEFTIGASVFLTLANSTFPGSLDEIELNHQEAAHRLLGYMASIGNRVAQVRQAELQHMEAAFMELDERLGGLSAPNYGPSGVQSQPVHEGLTTAQSWQTQDDSVTGSVNRIELPPHGLFSPVSWQQGSIDSMTATDHMLDADFQWSVSGLTHVLGDMDSAFDLLDSNMPDNWIWEV